MKYRQLGKTDLNVSVIGVGTWQFGGEWGKAFTPEEVKGLLGRAGELGLNLIDTAECYGDHLSEALIGQAIEGERDRWIIATKFGHKFPGPFERIDQWSPQEVQQQLEDSLRALRTETIDLYQFHSGSDQVFDQEALWSMLQRQIQAGKIRYLGLSVSSRIDPLYQIQRAAEVGVSAIQIIYNRLERSPEEKIFPVCQEQNLGVLARVPLASGLLSGKYQPGTAFTQPDDVRSRQDQADIQTKLKQVQEIQQNEAPPDVPLAAWALAWCLQHPAVSAVIPGCKTIEQVELNASAADL
ncbi:MAG: aldo/keto reductase [Anaerolineae bacterium]|nr:aldo/keto reductase [Anaerolineales bacterium]MCQ3978816.1 aldo/keto reductase [Anaerolineae bacterium]